MDFLLAWPWVLGKHPHLSASCDLQQVPALLRVSSIPEVGKITVPTHRVTSRKKNLGFLGLQEPIHAFLRATVDPHLTGSEKGKN